MDHDARSGADVSAIYPQYCKIPGYEPEMVLVVSVWLLN